MDDLLPLVVDEADPLGVEDFATHRVPLEEGPHAYEIFQKKQSGTLKAASYNRDGPMDAERDRLPLSLSDKRP